MGSSSPRGTMKFARRIVVVCAALAFLVGSAVSISQVRAVLNSARPETPVLFDHGLTGLRDEQIPAGWTNEQCGSCHQEEYEQWSISRHAEAGTNENFEAQFLNPVGGRQQWCLNCHTPFNPGADLFAVEEPDGIDEAFAAHPKWLANGVDCLACHVRDGQVLVTRASEKAAAAHPIRVTPELNTAEFCGGCHQFGMKHEEFPDLLDHPLQQASLEEFLDFRASGGSATRCHDCHMENGNHLMPGGYSMEMVQNALDLKLSATFRKDLRMAVVDVDVAAGHVGHRVPGGEHLFRALTMRTYLEQQDGTLATIATEPSCGGFAARAEFPSSATLVTTLPQVETIEHGFGPLEKVNPTPDTRLRPGETRRYRYVIPVGSQHFGDTLRVRTEIKYHLLDDEDARSHGFSPEEVKWVVVEEQVPLELESID